MVDPNNKIWQRIASKENELQPYYKRCDTDRNLLYLEKFIMCQYDGKTPIEDVINITLNTPVVFANDVMVSLINSTWQSYVEGSISKKSIRDIENFFTDVLAQIDEDLRHTQGIVNLKSWLAAHSVARSIIGTEIFSEIKDGKYKVRAFPMDMRYVQWEFGNDGFNWYSKRTWSTPAEIENIYGIKAKPDATSSTIEVRSYWDGEKNYVFIGGTELNETSFEGRRNYKYPQENIYGEPPAVIALPGTGFYLRDQNYLEHDNESIFFMDRSLYVEENRSATIAQTKAFELIKPPMMKPEEVIDAKDPDPAPQMGQTKKVKKDYEWQALQKPDINQSFQYGQQIISKKVSEGGYNSIDIGDASSNVNAIWITTQHDIRMKFIKPRLENMQSFYNMAGRKLIRQLKTITKVAPEAAIKVGATGKKRTYQSVQMVDPEDYTINVKLMSKDRRIELANASVASSLWDRLPRKYIYGNIMMVDDPDQMEREMLMEQANNANPSLAIFEMALAYAKQGDEQDGIDKMESHSISQSLMRYYKQLKLQSKMMQEPPEVKQQPQPQVSALAATAARS